MISDPRRQERISERPGARFGRIVCTEVYEMPEAQAPLNTITFTEVDGRTTLTQLVQTTSKDLRDTIIDSGMEAGMKCPADPGSQGRCANEDGHEEIAKHMTAAIERDLFPKRD